MADNKLLGASGLYFGGYEISKAYIGSNLVWEKSEEAEIDYSKEYFYIESINGNTQVSIKTNKAGYYRYVVLPHGTFQRGIDSDMMYRYWDDVYEMWGGDFTTTAQTQYDIVTLEDPGDILIILGNTEVIGSGRIENIFTLSDGVNVGGNIMSLTHGLDSNNDKVDPSTLPNKEYTARIGNTSQTRQLYRLFKNQPVVDASNLVLSAQKVLNMCYNEMFSNCSRLISGPAELPATTLSMRCYQAMFYGCTSLTTAPKKLPARTLATYCYQDMFHGCTSLAVPPILPATTLTTSCYYQMFYGCYSLIGTPVLWARTLANSCYYQMFYGCIKLTSVPILPATTLAAQCYYQMFRDCINLTSAPALPATTLQASCYTGMFRDCINLTSAPTLPATDLISNCYNQMFYGCTKLNYIKALFTTDPSGFNYLTDWVYNVSSTGTFVKNSEATWDVTGVNGIPEGWTVQTASS